MKRDGDRMSTDKPAKAKKPTPPATEVITVTKSATERDDAALARTSYDPAARAVGVGRKFIAPIMGERGAQDSFNALKEQIAEVKAGNLASVERTLVAQANTLDAVFNEMARRAALNMGEYINATDIYLRLALKAQAQCRATLETLAAIKNPPVVIAKQANVTTGPQQINNGTMAAVNHGGPLQSNQTSTHGRAQAQAQARAGEIENPPNQLSGEPPHELRQDAGAPRLESRNDPPLEALGAVYRP